MKAYILCILLVTLLNLINEKVFYIEKKRKIVSYLLTALSFLIVCGIAGVRHYTVGFDIRIYVTRLFSLSINNNIFSYLFHCNSDILFALVVYLGGIFKNIHLSLFFIESAVALPIYIYAFKIKKKYNQSFTVTILIFLLTMYCVSLSLMRQSVAMSFCILSYYFFDSNERKKAYILLIIACLFHKSALVFILVFFINDLIKSNNKNKKSIIFMFFLFLFFAAVFVKPIVSLTPYANYLYLSTRPFSIGAVIKRLFWIALVLVCKKSTTDKNYINELNITLLILILTVFTTVTSFYVSGTGRIGYYYIYLSNFLMVQQIPKKFVEQKVVIFILLIIFTVFWWIGTCVENDSSRVYPYHSEIITFLN